MSQLVRHGPQITSGSCDFGIDICFLNLFYVILGRLENVWHYFFARPNRNSNYGHTSPFLCLACEFSHRRLCYKSLLCITVFDTWERCRDIIKKICCGRRFTILILATIKVVNRMLSRHGFEPSLTDFKYGIDFSIFIEWNYNTWAKRTCHESEGNKSRVLKEDG